MSCFYQKLGFFGFFSLGDVRKGRWTDKKCRHPPQDTDGFLMLPRVVTWAPPASLLVCKHLLLLWSHLDTKRIDLCILHPSVFG